MTQIITNFSDISDQYDAAFVDLWGCMHNGIEAFTAAVAAMQKFRAEGGIVVLVTNSPRPRFSVAEQIAGMGIPTDCYDTIATSGDSARSAMFQGVIGDKVWFMGEEHRDADFFKPLSVLDNPVEIKKVPLDEATGIVCCGPFDTQADPNINRPEFLLARERGLKLLCANPDIIVDRGETREWCAGALAKLYTDMGGESLYFGKPHPPIYDLARLRLAGLQLLSSEPRIICIGDGIGTDVLGGVQEDLDTLFITGGLAAAETKTVEQPDADALASYLEKEIMSPTYAIGFLR
jgi:HAD superfamily hydrolase (TIGR01459 family)